MNNNTEKENNKKAFYVYDIVRVIKPGHCFDTYSRWAELYNLKRWKRSRQLGYRFNDIKADDQWRVIVVEKHDLEGKNNMYGYIYGIENLNTGAHFIMGRLALTLARKAHILPEELFEI